MESEFSFAPFERHIQEFLEREDYDGAAIGVIQVTLQCAYIFLNGDKPIFTQVGR